MFLNRISELRDLDEQYRLKQFSLIIIYGRRRTGKTLLSVESSRRSGQYFYFLSETGTLKDNAERFAVLVARKLDDFTPKIQSFAEAFEYLKKRIGSNPAVVIIDEFPYLVKISDDILSQFQRIVDEILSDTSISLILVGSSMGMMKSHVLNYKSPLYGRRSMQIKLQPFVFKDSLKFFPEFRFSDKIIAYAILGGMPAYLSLFNPKKSIMDNIREKILKTVSFLYSEGEFLLKEEFYEVHTYRKILHGITKSTKLSEIANYVGRPASELSRYIKNLIDLDFIRRQNPLIGKIRRPHYYLNDNYLDFWFRFIYPNQDLIESVQQDQVLEMISNSLNSYIGLKFEQICKEFLLLINKEQQLPFRIEKIGRQWGHIPNIGQYEIDLIAINETEKKIMFIECKWQEQVRRKVINDLKQKSQYIGIDDTWDKYYAVIAKSIQFTMDKQEFSWDLSDLQQVFENN